MKLSLLVTVTVTVCICMFYCDMCALDMHSLLIAHAMLKPLTLFLVRSSTGRQIVFATAASAVRRLPAAVRDNGVRRSVVEPSLWLADGLKFTT